jgi:hypothetical protein
MQIKYYLIMPVLIISIINARKPEYIPIPNPASVSKLTPQQQVETFRNYITKAGSVPALYTAVIRWIETNESYARLAQDNKALVLYREYRILENIRENTTELLSTDPIEQMKKLDDYMARINPRGRENKKIKLVLQETPEQMRERLAELKNIFSNMLASYYVYFEPEKQVLAVKVLVANGANPNATVKNAGPALRYVISSIIQRIQNRDPNGLQVYTELLHELLADGANPNVHPKTEPYTEQLAQVYTPESLMIIRTLIDHGARITPRLEKIAENEKKKSNPELYNLLRYYKQGKPRDEMFQAYERGD